MPVAWLTTEYGDPSAWAAYESVPLWLTCEDSGPSRTVAREVLPSTPPRAGPPSSNGPATATATPAAATSTRTAAPTSSCLRRLGLRGTWRPGSEGLGAGTLDSGTCVFIGVLIGHRRRRRLGAASG